MNGVRSRCQTCGRSRRRPPERLTESGDRDAESIHHPPDHLAVGLDGGAVLMARKARSTTKDDLDQAVGQLTADEQRDILTWAAEWHTDVERRVRLSAARLR